MAKKAAKSKSKKKQKKAAKSPIKDHAHKVWLAGLGALAVAEVEGGKLFNHLIEMGGDLEKRGKPVVDKMVKDASKKAAEVRKKAGSRAGKVGDEAKAGWSKVEGAVDETVTSALHKLGIPTRKEIEELSKRVEALTAKLDGKPAKKTTARRPATRKTARKPAAKKTARKPAAKKATARKPAAKKTAARKPAAKKTTAKAPAAEV